MERTIVLYPGLAVSHLLPMMELAKAFLRHGYAVSVAFIDSPNKPASLAAAVDYVVASNPSISVQSLLPPQAPPPSTGNNKDFILSYYSRIRSYNDRLRSFLCSLPLQRVHALVIDIYSLDALDVAKKLGVPAYVFYPAGATSLAIYLQLPSLSAKSPRSFGELGDTPLPLVGVLPMPASHLSREMLAHPESELFRASLSLWGRVPGTSGIIVNTFQSLENPAVQALGDPTSLVIPNKVLPPVFCVGPLVQTTSPERTTGDERHECLAWLDGQPDRGVVFLCFGSIGTHSAEQLREIAEGLETSGHRFLWVVRAPMNTTAGGKMPLLEPDLEEVLPIGFLERTKARGLVVKSWAPQVDVLRHAATGAFVTHCGWNSVLEAVTAGMPMLCWPLYAEQKINKVFLVEEVQVGVEMVGWKERLVEADEVAAKVRLVMGSAHGEELRDRVMAHREGAGAALEDGGSSRVAFARLLANVEKAAASSERDIDDRDGGNSKSISS